MFVLFGHSLLFAQKNIERQFQADHIRTVNLDATNSFEIFVETVKAKTISVEAEVAGENSEQMVLVTKNTDDELQITTEFQPLFTVPDDKLSAHKVMSIIFRLKVPEGINLIISSDIGSVFVTGKYNQLTTELNHGHFVAKKFLGSALVNTIDGNITIESNYAKVNLDTKNGQIFQENLLLGTNNLSLHSINGNISVTKTK